MVNSKDIAEELYRSFKSQVLWKNVDFKRMEKFEKIINKRFILELDKMIDELKSTGVTFSTTETENIKTEATELKTPEDNRVTFEHQTLLQRVIEAQDAQIDNIIKNDIIEKKLDDITTTLDNDIIQENVDKLDNITEIKDLANNLKNKRYYITLHCNGVIKKPNFQLFKTQDIIEKDFKTDDITKHVSVYNAYIDTNDKKNIYIVMKEYFINPSIVDIYEVDDTIPVQYKTIWQNKTNL